MKEKTTIKQKHMKKILMMFALLLGVSAAWAQQSSGDYYEGLTRKIGFSQMIPPHGLEITYDKTVHVIFPAPVKYVDLGSTNLIAGKADGAENVIRVKATTRNFREETNMSVITEDGNFYTFNVKYADEPLLLNVEMCDFIHDGESVNRPNNAMEIYLTELDNESPRLVRLIMKSVYENDKRRIRHIDCKRFGIQYLLKGLYTHNDLLYFHTQVKNSSNVPFDVDFITFKVVDKKVMKRTAMQEQVIYPLRAYNYVTRVNGRDSECSVGQAEAQRILPRMQGVEMRGGMASDNGYYMGMILSSYAKGGNKWIYGAEYLHMKHGYRHVTIPSAQFTAEGGYYLNFLSDAGKVFFLNLGGSALAGYETVNWSDKKLYDGATLKNGDAFVYGCALTLEMELYLADRVALTASLRERFLWGGSLGHCHTQYGIGIRFMIN